MQYHILIETDDSDGQVSISSDVADAVVRAARQVDGVQSAKVLQIGTELQELHIP